MNNVSLLGRLTADPELKQTPNGTPVCSFGIAVNRSTTDANGNRQADFLNCVAWRHTAEFITKYFKKGQMLGITGAIQTRQYKEKDTGKQRTAVEIVVNNAYFAGSSGNTGSNTNPAAIPNPAAAVGNPAAPANTFGNLDDFSAIASDDGDLPF